MFDKKHSYWQWGLMLKTAPVISPPEPKTKYVDIPGNHGALDLSELLSGGVRYKNRNISLDFVSMADRKRWSVIYSDILASLHGRAVKITFDDDPMNYYFGRVTVGDPSFENGCVFLTVKAEVNPFKTNLKGVKKL